MNPSAVLGEEIDIAIERFTTEWDRLCEEPADDTEQETTMAATTKKPRRERKSDRTLDAWRTDAGELYWRCPQCCTEHHESKKACSCEYVRPLLRRLVEIANAAETHDRMAQEVNGHAGVPETQAAAAAKEEAVSPPAAGISVTEDAPIGLVDENPLNTRRNLGDLDQLAASLKHVGQLQECVGRRKGQRIELVAGGRRYRAARLAGLRTLRVRIVDCDDLEALETMGRENEDRESWDAISKAAWYQALLAARQCSTRDLAEHLSVSQSEIANHVRMLKLPEAWQQRVISQEINASMARALATWSDRPAVLKELARQLNGAVDHDWTTSDFEACLRETVESHTRPCEPRAYYRFQAKKGWRSGRVLFTEADLECWGPELDIVTVSGGARHRKDERRAFNTKRWDELHGNLEEESRKKADEKAARQASKSPGTAGGEKKKRERTEAEEKFLKSQQRKQLETKVWRYKVRWLQQRAAAAMLKAEGYVGIKLLLAFGATDDHQGRRRSGLVDVVRSAGGKSRTRGCGGADPWQTIATLPTDDRIPELARQCLAAWLQLEVFDGWRLPLRPGDVVIAATELGVALSKEWRVEQQFLELFSKDQLVSLVKEWKLPLNAAALKTSKRGRVIEDLLEHDKRKRLPVPKILTSSQG